MKNCPICGREILILKHTYCSVRCANEALKKRNKYTCEICGIVFEQRASHAKRYKHHYCSKKCMGIANHKEQLWQSHNCLVCGKPIEAKGGHYRKYCSMACNGVRKRVDGALWRNPEHIKAYMRRYELEHKEELNAKARERVKANPEIYRAIKRRWDKAHPDVKAMLNYKRYEIKSEGKVTGEDWKYIKEKYDYQCPRCLKREPEIKLSIDHIIPLSKGGKHTKDNIQPLCRRCNCSKNAKTVRYPIPKQQELADTDAYLNSVIK